jgi:hypothetical protein
VHLPDIFYPSVGIPDEHRPLDIRRSFSTTPRQIDLKDIPVVARSTEVYTIMWDIRDVAISGSAKQMLDIAETWTSSSGQANLSEVHDSELMPFLHSQVPSRSPAILNGNR